MKFMIQKVCVLVAGLAMFLAHFSLNQACFFWYHQPTVPEELTK